MPNDHLATATACVIVKDEMPYILEWVAFHRAIGFDKFVFYSNDCVDGTDTILDRLALHGIIRHVRWPSMNHTSPQVAAYEHARKECSTTWMMCFDIDEFLVLKHDDSLRSFLSRFQDDVSAIAINWRVFGSSGFETMSAEPVIQRFMMASEVNRGVNKHCKTIAKVACVDTFHIHRCFLNAGRYVNCSGLDVSIERLGFTPSVDTSLCQINHYVLKSKEEFRTKQLRGNANRGSLSVDKYSSRYGDYFAKHDLNEIADNSVMRWNKLFEDSLAELTVLLSEEKA